MITRTVTPSEDGKRLHRYLCKLMPNYPLGQIYKLIDQGKVRVNGKRKKQNYELCAGDVLELYMDEADFAEAQATEVEKKPKFAGVPARIDVVFEDRELLVVNKPVGLLTHPDQKEQKDTLINRVHAYLYRKGELDSGLFLPATANRLDRNTSGLVLIGKTAGMLHQLNQWVQRHELRKSYLTIVQGRLHGESEISGRLLRDEGSNRTRVIGEGAAPPPADPERRELEALTRYKALSSSAGHTLVEVELISGRTHQIRTHFQSIGHPLLGDIKYGGRAYGGVNHQLLHAWRLELPNDTLYRAPLPSEFRAVLQQLNLPLPAADSSR